MLAQIRYLVLAQAIIFGSISLLPGDEPIVGKRSPQELNGLPEIFHADFERGTLEGWEFADPKAWKIEQVDGNQVLAQFQQSDTKTPVRSPFNRALVSNVTVEDFILDVDLQSTARDYAHRDLCLFFGYQDPGHMYYVHFGQKTDDHANQIFIVNNEPRRKISTETTEGTAWDNHWHKARIIRDVSSGSIEIYFDDLKKPVMKAVDKTFTWGQVGVGSFDDTGRFDQITVYGRSIERPAERPSR